MISFTFIWNWGMANIWSWDVLPKISFLFPRMLFLGSIFRMKHTLLITTWDTAIQEGVAFFSNLSSVQLLSHVWLFATPWSAAHQASLSFTNSWSLLKLMSIKLVMPPNHLILCHPLLFLPSIFPSIRDFSNESVLHIRWPNYWSFSFNIVLPMNIQDLFPLGWTGWIFLLTKGLSRVLSNSTVQKHQFFGAQLSLWSNSHIHT